MLIQRTIENKLNEAFTPVFFEVTNESFMHAVPANSETHFKVVVVSEQFSSHRLVKRHQLIYKLLSDELAGDVHALALHTFTPEEWALRQAKVVESPKCASNVSH